MWGSVLPSILMALVALNIEPPLLGPRTKNQWKHILYPLYSRVHIRHSATAENTLGAERRPKGLANISNNSILGLAGAGSQCGQGHACTYYAGLLWPSVCPGRTLPSPLLPGQPLSTWASTVLKRYHRWHCDPLVPIRALCDSKDAKWWQLLPIQPFFSVHIE